MCNAHSVDAVKYLNENIKNRSSFRPVAPVVLNEDAVKYFNLSDKIYDCYYYMGAVADVIKKDNIQAVVHKDGTAEFRFVMKINLGKILKKLKKKI